MTEIRWEDPPRLLNGGGKAALDLVAFAEALRAEPKRWAVWPRSHASDGARQNAAHRIKRGQFGSLGEGFDACIRNGVLYVRYVGDEPASP